MGVAVGVLGWAVGWMSRSTGDAAMVMRGLVPPPPSVSPPSPSRWMSTAQRQHLIQTAANEELLVGIKTKVDALTVAPHPTKVTEAQNINAHTEVKKQLGKRLTPEWLALNGLTSLTEETVPALLLEFTGALQEVGSEASSTILAPLVTEHTAASATPKPATLRENKRRLGEGADGS